jgi:hypothetical protein
MSKSTQMQTIGRTASTAAAHATSKRVHLSGAFRQKGCWWDLRYPRRID